MFSRLFAASGLSMERLRALVEIGAYGSIVRAAGGDPTRQSLYSRQIKELEDFFQVPLLERSGRGVRLTAPGRELARISRFFLLGLSNFQRGCLSESQMYRIGADATFTRCFLLPALSSSPQPQARIHFSVETASGDQIERRLHDLTLDFGVVNQRSLSRPLQAKELGRWKLSLWVPKSLSKTARQAEQAFAAKRLPLVLAGSAPPGLAAIIPQDYEPALNCEDYLAARDALSAGRLAGLLPDFLAPANAAQKFLRVRTDKLAQLELCYNFAWNPRLLRLNSHAGRRRDALVTALTERVAAPAAG